MTYILSESTVPQNHEKVSFRKRETHRPQEEIRRSVTKQVPNCPPTNRIVTASADVKLRPLPYRTFTEN